ncbi:MAG TPA: hypothetical protein PKY82_24345 [Pyrinomonadaceae bacterium]|nr:hypothetical protein [Pyrinomonadaceae bacterium]
MKKLILILFILIISTFSIIAQSPCPRIMVFGPSHPIKIGDLMAFSATVEGNSIKKLKFKWIVSNGEIIYGQGDLAIVIPTTEDMAGQTITATFEVSGLPENCTRSLSSAVEVEPRVIADFIKKLDEYGKISWRNEKKKLDEVANVIKSDNDLTLIFRIQIVAKNSSQIFKINSTRIEKYLTVKHKIPKRRIKIVFGGNKENQTEIYFNVVGTPLPF